MISVAYKNYLFFAPLLIFLSRLGIKILENKLVDKGIHFLKKPIGQGRLSCRNDKKHLKKNKKIIFF